MTEYLKRITTGLCTVAAVVATTTFAEPAEKAIPVDVAVTTDVLTDYAWRGQLLNDDPVVQPGVTLSYKGLSLNVWGSVDATDIHEVNGEEWRLQEVDYTGSYTFTPLKGLDLTGGIIEYTFPGTPYDNTRELFGTVKLSEILLAPTLSVYRDIDECDGWYANLGVSHTFSITEQLGLTLGANAGWGDREYHEFYMGGLKKSALSDVQLASTLTYAVTDWCSVSGYLRYSDFLNHDVREAADETYAESGVIVGGVGISLCY
ncbi:MAG: hypothetical protein A3K19_15195 [Lentisphaerae bacterium RIFOXYB12_FULL_65_16]|nr:MAG: hypothetical protein A3K18_06895 [Lentisphaerae bacterium RIFOXYA12_64_32]OGV88438.1 MAG: hypothetical protein A3K19_15195 [Lentisphaerae bacterium RIFOXYB12_FULL_65_16]